MGKYIHYQGYRIDPKEEIRAPKKRFNISPSPTEPDLDIAKPLPCYTKEICQVEHCKEVDRIVGRTIFRDECDKDCLKRIVISDVPITVCLLMEKMNGKPLGKKGCCEFLNLDGLWCKKQLEETKVHHRPPPCVFPKGLRTPTGTVRGWYGQKKLDGSGDFV